MNGRRTTLYNRDKASLLTSILDRYDCRYRVDHQGDQKVSCINDAEHPNGDRNPSASINLSKGLYHCFACGLSGDGYSLLRNIEGWDAKKVNEMMDSPEMKEESEWLL